MTGGTMAKRTALTEKQKNILRESVQADKTIDFDKQVGLIEQWLNKPLAKSQFVVLFLSFATLAASIVTIIVFPNNLIPSIVLYAVFYLGLMVTLMLARNTDRERVALFAILRCITRVEASTGSPIMASQRLLIAQRLPHCARRIRVFGALFPIGLSARIISREARLGGEALKKLVYPALTGNDEDLRKINEILARTAFYVANGQWIRVRQLNFEGPDYTLVNSTPGWLSGQTLIALAGALSPLIVFFLPLIF
jgi:hypothetical protein